MPTPNWMVDQRQRDNPSSGNDSRGGSENNTMTTKQPNITQHHGGRNPNRRKNSTTPSGDERAGPVGFGSGTRARSSSSDWQYPQPLHHPRLSGFISLPPQRGHTVVI